MSDDTSVSEKIREKWNRIYQQQESDQIIGKPALVLTENQQWLPSKGRALEIACGRGHNAKFLAERGLEVDAWDISDIAINDLSIYAKQSGLPIRPAQLDINAATLTPHHWDVIVICHYLDRSIMPFVRAALATEGLLFMQTFTADKLVSLGPSNAHFLLQRDELLSMTQGMEVLAYRNEGSNTDIEAPLAGRAYIVARA